MSVVRGSCLCGDVAWEATGPLELMSHCHCSRCRKAHGAAFSTAVLAAVERFRLVRGADRIVLPAGGRAFCGRCGSNVPGGEPWEGRVFLPAGPLDDDPGVRPLAHIFVGSKAPWFDVRDGLPRFDEFPPGIDVPVLPERPPTDPPAPRARGSCLCDGVRFAVSGEALRVYHCHCSRCRKARAAAFASNLFVPADGVRFTRGEELLASYKVPEARFFMQVFCRACGSPMPRVDRERGFAVVPMGGLDDDPGVRAQCHIYTGSKAPWYEITDDLPQHPEGPPAAG